MECQALGPNGASANFGTSDVYIRAYINIATLPAANDEQLFYVAGSSGTVGVRVNSSGNITLYNNEGATPSLLGTGTTALALSTWYMIEGHFHTGNGAATDTYEVKINGTVELTGTAQIGLAGATWNQVYFGKTLNKNGQTVDFYYDDIAIDDAAYPGAGQVNILKPRAAGASAQWTTGTSSLFSAVNEVPPNGDTTYIADATSGDASSFAMDSSATGGVIGTITVVKTVAIGRDVSSTPSVKVRLRNGTTNNDTTGANPGASYAVLARLDANDPNTAAAWASSGLDTIECGVVSGASATARVTAIYAMVECAGAPSFIPHLAILGVG